MRGINIMKKSEVFIALSEKFGNQTITRKDIQEYLKSITEVLFRKSPSFFAPGVSSLKSLS